MRYFLEVWFRGEDADAFRDKTAYSSIESHPHITFVRPFEINKDKEKLIKQKIVSYCRGKKPIKFILEGKGSFGDVEYVPVTSKELEKFDAGLEKVLEGEVEFDKKLNDKKILHVTLTKKIVSFPRTKSVMQRLVCLRDKKIWFSYDFVRQEVLNREETLNES